MKSLTIHGMDDAMAGRLGQLARESGLSLNKLIKKLLAKATGMPTARTDRRKDFEDLCGLWSAKETAALRKAISGFDRVDPEDWE